MSTDESLPKPHHRECIVPTTTNTPYIGITGFTTRDEVSAVLASLPESPARLLMCGVLLSNALLSGDASDAPNRCPHPDAIAGIFSDDPRCLNLIHYRPQPGDNLADALARASEVGGPNCHGVQINATRGVPWPDPAALVEYLERSQPRRIVLQAGREAMASVDGDPARLAQRCAEYAGIVTDVLVDASEGLGLPLDANRSSEYLEALADTAPDLGLVVAGGLHAGNIDELLSPLLPRWANVSIDAEGRLRDADDRLDAEVAVGYSRAAMGLLVQASR